MTLKSALLFFCFLLMTVKFTVAQPGTGTPTRNDHIFPSAPSAKPFINYDARGFLINGKRTFITSASMEYARVPHALWRDRLLRLKRAGFNTIEMYTFWNFHEPNEGKFNFAGDHDLNAYLQLIKSMGMYAIVRVGPYECGEWSMGGYPIWLKFKPGLRVREDNPQFLSAVDHFFDKLIPIVTKNQINHGGAVIMVQLENEHRAGWGTVTPNNYFKHLKDKTVALGLQVPYYFSGLHSGNDPSGDFTSLDDPARPNPWFCPEYWGVWFLNYGPQELDSTLYDRRTWKMLAHGANGYNVYMAHGGSNFEYFNDKENAASYDYGAAVGQAGDLRPIYYAFKRANWFAQSFQNVLENSLDEQNNKPLVSDTNIKVTVRKSPAGTISFLDNTDSIAHHFKFTSPANIPIKTSTEIKLAAGEIMPLVQDYQLTPQAKLAWAPTKIYGIIPQGKTTTLIVYGATGTTAQLYFNVKRDVKTVPANFKLVNGLLNFHTNITPSPAAYRFADVKIIVMNDELISRNWFAEANGQNHIIIGPDYAADLISKDNKLNLVTEKPWGVNKTYPTWIFKPVGSIMKSAAPVRMVKRMVSVVPGPWRVKSAAMPASPRFDDSKWLQSKDPLQMGADGNVSASAWYRAHIKVAGTGDYILQFTHAPERGAIFLDGARVDTAAVFAKEITIKLKANINHTLSIFTAHNGRNKLIFKIGVIDTLDIKGIEGPVTLKKGNGREIAVNNWRMRGGPGDMSDGKDWNNLSRSNQKYLRVPVKNGFGSLYVQQPPYYGPTLYRATLNLPVSKQSYAIWRVNTTSLSYGSVWVNGHNLGVYPEKIKINGMYIPECWLKQGANTIVIYDENGVSPKDVRIEVEQAASRDVETLEF
ncbi:MAG: beta-galactosidase [Bacteroidota bacterium]